MKNHIHENINKGEIYMLAPEDERGSIPRIKHPYVVVQDNVFNHSRIETVVVCGISSNLKRASEPGCVLLELNEAGLKKQSVVIVSQISSVN